jgi:hypothetical protein
MCMHIIYYVFARACIVILICTTLYTCKRRTECKHLQSLNTPRWIHTAEATTSHLWMGILPMATSRWFSNLATSKVQHLSAAIRHKTTRQKATSTTTLVRRRNRRRIAIREAGLYRRSTMGQEVQHTAAPLDTVQQLQPRWVWYMVYVAN